MSKKVPPKVRMPTIVVPFTKIKTPEFNDILQEFVSFCVAKINEGKGWK